MRTLHIALFVLPLLLTACGSSAGESGYAKVGAPGRDEQTCRRDDECTLVEDCCGCRNGGSRAAVRSDAVEALSAAAATSCAGRQCAEGVESNHRSCQASGAACRGGRCIPRL